MLAYVFWHSPAAGAAVPTYHADLVAYHRSLAAHPPLGFVRSGAAGLAAASWLAGMSPAYEDWYLVSGWPALGALNQGAVDATHLARHDRIAGQSGAGAGGIYALQAGDAAVDHSIATWFGKPAGWGYGDLDTALASAVPPGAALWQRQMVLGPAPEFCLRSSAPVRLPTGLIGEQVAYHPLI
jgi:hypothetical protein